MNIDLSGLTAMIYTLSFDEISGNVTFDFRDSAAPETSLGTLVIETSKYRAFTDSLRKVATEVPAQTFQSEFNHSTQYNVRENTAEIAFT
jgi:hypothetical protein